MFVTACSMFACNQVQLSLNSIKGNLLTYLLTYLLYVCHLPPGITSLSSLEAFKRALKTELFRRSYGDAHYRQQYH